MRRAVLLAAAVIPLACATTAGKVGTDPPETCITIDNREGARLGPVYLASEAFAAIPLSLNNIEAGVQERHCVSRSGHVGNWWLESRDADISFFFRTPRSGIRRVGSAGEHTYVSPDFFFEAGSEISWDTSKNYVYVNGLRFGGL